MARPVLINAIRCLSLTPRVQFPPTFAFLSTGRNFYLDFDTRWRMVLLRGKLAQFFTSYIYILWSFHLRHLQQKTWTFFYSSQYCYWEDWKVFFNFADNCLPIIKPFFHDNLYKLLEWNMYFKIQTGNFFIDMRAYWIFNYHNIVIYWFIFKKLVHLK